MIGFKKFETEFKDRKFIIEEDYPEVGCYLYVFKNNTCVEDFLQNDIDMCKHIALENFEVPLESWLQVKN